MKRVEIPKPDGGIRKLGIPTVLDRFIQQAVMQVLQRSWDGTFSNHSYGFRPRRSAHQAVTKAQQYIAEGYGWVVDLDLEKFFDRVNHDKLMAKLAQRISDRRLLKLILAFLRAGVMANGLVGPVDEGTPQGGPLSPLLSNIVLDELDRELERRGHRFVRYADDSNIYVRSRRAGERVMTSIAKFITTKLKLKVNDEKSAVDRPGARKFLGFSFTGQREPRRRIAPKAVQRFKQRVRELTRRTRGVSVETMVQQLNRYLIGWRGYFGFCQTPSVLQSLEKWLRRRLRSVVWKQWRRGKVRFAELTKRGVGKALAAKQLVARMARGGSVTRPLSVSPCPMLTSLRSVFPRWSVSLNSPNRRVRTRMHGGVTGKAGDSLPMSISVPTLYQPLPYALHASLEAVSKLGVRGRAMNKSRATWSHNTEPFAVANGSLHSTTSETPLFCKSIIAK